MAVTGQDSCNIAMVDMADRIEAHKEIERLNDALETRVSQLGEANDELEAFSSSVAHDLQTPLTALDGFRVLLEQALKDGELTQARHCAQRIGTLIAQMGQTTSGLLALARVTRGTLQWVDCDLSRMSTEIAQALREHHPARQVELNIEPGLHACGDPALLRQMLVNLLGNAWKFTSGQPVARIHLAREAAGANRQVCFVVEDNGAGFEMAHAGRLFGAFERLHSSSEFPGSGIGLATVKRIVARHGGHISASGVPGQGARFRFSLPAVPRANGRS
jgi:signal transduction histidine kinase